MYSTQDIFGVEIKIFGAAARLLGAKMGILDTVVQPMAWQRAVTHLCVPVFAPKIVCQVNVTDLSTHSATNNYIFHYFYTFSYTTAFLSFSTLNRQKSE